MKPIVGLAVVKNEDDVIEAMIRHNLQFLDHLHIVDNGSADRTPEIIAALIEEGLPLSSEKDAGIDHRQDEIVTDRLAIIADGFGPIRLFLLDADEFIKADAKTFRDKATATHEPLLLRWQTYIPTPKDDPALLNVLQRVTHRRVSEAPKVHKVTIPDHLIRHVTVRKGNHQLQRGEEFLEAAVSKSIGLAHIPIRSREQLIAKVLVGSWSVRLRNGKTKRREAFHWHRLAERFWRDTSLSPEELTEIAIRYAAKRESDLVEDPIPVTFSLKYTEGHDERLLVKKLADFTEALVRQHIDQEAE